jgi:DNA repair exonuclease SbcCD ATPase subunit
VVFTRTAAAMGGRMKKIEIPEVSAKSTKDQILAAYNDVLLKLNEKQAEIPQDLKKKQEEKAVISKAAAQSADAIVSDLSAIKLKAIKQIDTLSEELLHEFGKLSDVRQAIILEQKHLQDLYQINETANTLAALLQTHSEQKEQFKLDMEKQKQIVEQSLATQRAHWKQENETLEREFNEQKEKLEKSRKREEEEYSYALQLKRRKEADDYTSQRTVLEKELLDRVAELKKREDEISEREKNLENLEAQVAQFPERLKEAISQAEETLRNEILQHHKFESQLKEKEYEGIIKLNDQRIASFTGKIKEQELLIKELTQKADQATQQVQSIANRALDTSVQRYVTVSGNNEER